MREPLGGGRGHLIEDRLGFAAREARRLCQLEEVLTPGLIRQRIVEETEDRAEGPIPVLDEARLRRELERGEPERLAQEGGIVLEVDLLTELPRAQQ